MKKIKLIWDFRGPLSQKTAQHHHKHLEEFFKFENKKLFEHGTKSLSDIHNYTYAIVLKEDLEFFKAKLKPHRGQSLE
ncbi:MAG: hypothetical protein CMC53_00560 [Flavobacteriaceae bacterium]|nr:hypothetical protein [Flavobacteriaceae bacterium]